MRQRLHPPLRQLLQVCFPLEAAPGRQSLSSADAAECILLLCLRSALERPHDASVNHRP